MDNKKRNEFAFIICVDDELYAKECISYIQKLHIPEGYASDIITVRGADSIAEAYQAAMESSEARYKIYLRQELFITDRTFLDKVLTVFQNNYEIGMIGALGARQLMLEENMDFCWDTGSISYYDGRAYKIKKGVSNGLYTEVIMAFEGVLVTQYDVPWRKDILPGWEFYELSQSLEMQRRGYKVVVPEQEEPWCYYDKMAPVLRSFDVCWEVLQKEYGLPELPMKELVEQMKKRQKEEALRCQFQRLFGAGKYETLRQERWTVANQNCLNYDLRNMLQCIEIYTLEQENNRLSFSKWWDLSEWKQIEHRYREIRFMALSMCLYEEERDKVKCNLQKKIEEHQVSTDAICKVLGMYHADCSIQKEFFTALEKEPLVTVITSVHNCEDVVGKMIESVLGQSYQNIEFIIVDDASTDKSREVIGSYNDARVKPIFLQENHHICYACNLAMERAGGEYIALIGHDDIWKKDKLEKQIAFLESHRNYSVCFTWANVIDGEGRNVNHGLGEHIVDLFARDNDEQDAWLRKLVIDGNCLCAPSACIRKSMLDEAGYYRYGVLQLQDYELWMRLLERGGIYLIQEQLTDYRRFFGTMRNLDSGDADGRNRLMNEIYWCKADVVRKMQDKQFVNVFQNELLQKGSLGNKEVRCEKAIFLWNQGNPYADEMFFELLEDGECRKILEENYQISLLDFYKLNTTQWFSYNGNGRGV